MTKQVQRRRGTATQHTSFTGAEGELSVNTTNKSVHVHDGSTAGGIELARKDGSNVAFTSGTLDGVTIGGSTAGAGTFTNLTATGTTTLAGASTSANITFGDNDKAIFGAGSDLQIYHDGVHSRISDEGTGNLILKGSSAIVFSAVTNGEHGRVTDGGGWSLGYSGSEKLATTSTGISVTGNATFADNGKAIFGAGSDLQIYHDGSNSRIQEAGSGNLVIRASAGTYIQGVNGENGVVVLEDGAVTLWNDGSSKLATTSTGIDVTGEVEADTAHFGTGTGTGPTVADEVVVSGTGSTGLTIHSPDASNATLAFGSATDNDYAFLQGYYNSGSPFIRASIQNSEVAKITNTGIDVTGTVTADGLTVDGTDTEAATSQLLKVRNSTTGEAATIGLYAKADNGGDGNSGSITFDAGADGSSANNELRFNADHQTDTNPALSIKGNGDISFYEDTGTTAKFFWDASAESLGIGTTGVGAPLHVYTSGNAVAKLESTTANANLVFRDGTATADVTVGSVDNGEFRIQVNNGERMRIDSSGNVGIGTTSPASALHIDAADSATGGFRMKNTAGESVEFYYASSAADADFIINRTGSGAADIGLKHTGDVYFTSGQVGIGTSSPSALLHLESAGPSIKLVDNDNNPDYEIKNGNGSFRIIDTTAGSDRINIDSSGNLLVGKTTADAGATAGMELRSDDILRVTRSGAPTTAFNRLSTDGTITAFQKDGTTVGSIGIQSTGFYIDGESSHAGIRFGGSNVSPRDNGADVDNGVSLGQAAYRWSQIYAANATINTSDRNEKQDIEELNEAEARVAVACKGLLRKFRWKDAVAEKGDEARTHFGIIAQDLQAAFAAEGLDAGDYAMFIHTTWTDEETGEERSRMGVRYSELLAFIIAAI